MDCKHLNENIDDLMNKKCESIKLDLKNVVDAWLTTFKTK